MRNTPTHPALKGGLLALLAAALFGVKSVNEKAGALSKIVELMRTYDITPAEVAVVFRDPSLIETAPAKRSSGEVAKKLFTYLGAIFILAGIGTYIGMFWNRMGSVMRIVVTLGVGYTLLVVLVSALHEKKFPKLILPLCLATVFMHGHPTLQYINHFAASGELPSRCTWLAFPSSRSDCFVIEENLCSRNNFSTERFCRRLAKWLLCQLRCGDVKCAK